MWGTKADKGECKGGGGKDARGKQSGRIKSRDDSTGLV